MGFKVARKGIESDIFSDSIRRVVYRACEVYQILSLSSEGYTAKAGCVNGIESVKKNADSEVAFEE